MWNNQRAVSLIFRCNLNLRDQLSLDAEHQATVQKMSKQSGAEFDKAYSMQMVNDHRRTAALFQGATKSCVSLSYLV
jgi:predicted outer membrane protein